MTKDAYTFGSQIAKKIDYFAFPRTGSHFLWACFTGLFDLVFYENEYTRLPEAVQRFEELNPLAVYSLKLRQDGIPFQPVFIDAKPNGLHSQPSDTGNKKIILIRDPHPAIYSLFKTAKDRWGHEDAITAGAVKDRYEEYRDFYRRTFDLAKANQNLTLVLRYEELKEDRASLDKLIEFVGVTPKLNSDFVRHWTEFQNMTKEGHRTFYRQGDNSTWSKDSEWKNLVDEAAVGSFEEFGY